MGTTEIGLAKVMRYNLTRLDAPKVWPVWPTWKQLSHEQKTGRILSMKFPGCLIGILRDPYNLYCFFGNPHKTAWLVQSPYYTPKQPVFCSFAPLQIPTCFQPKTLWETPPCRKSWLPMVMPLNPQKNGREAGCNVKYIGNGYNAYLVMSYQ